MSPTEPSVVVTLELLKHSQGVAFSDGFRLAQRRMLHALHGELDRLDKEPTFTRRDVKVLDTRRDAVLDLISLVKGLEY